MRTILWLTILTAFRKVEKATSNSEVFCGILLVCIDGPNIVLFNCPIDEVLAERMIALGDRKLFKSFALIPGM